MSHDGVDSGNRFLCCRHARIKLTPFAAFRADDVAEFLSKNVASLSPDPPGALSRFRLFQRCQATSLVSIDVASAETLLSTGFNTASSTDADLAVDFQQHRSETGFTICKHRMKDLQLSAKRYTAITYIQPNPRIKQSSLRANHVWHTGCFTSPASTLIKVTS